MIRVLIADDHPIVREGIKQILSHSGEMDVVGEAMNGQQILDFVSGPGCDVVVMDFSMPGKSGMDVLRDLRRHQRHVRILVLSMHAEEELGPRVLKAGASGYLTKESAPRELVDAVRKVASGGTYVTASLAETLVHHIAPGRSEDPHGTLSDREFEVFLALASGKSTQEIAKALSLSVKTVRTYRDRVMAKMGLRNDVDFAHYAIQHGLLDGKR
ncbi:MAG: response regulator transcription factor [Bacteroidota bacterium]